MDETGAMDLMDTMEITGDALNQAVAILQAQHHRIIISLGLGVFWIMAEICILFMVWIGRRRLEIQPLPTRISLTRAEKLRALSGSVLLLFMLTLAAFFFCMMDNSGTARLHPGNTGSLSIHGFSSLYSSMEISYLALWALFTKFWVLLEIFIVMEGWRGYRRLRMILAPAKENGRA